MPALTSQTEMAKEGIRNLGYPEYFGTALAVFIVLGVLTIIIPAFPARMKDWYMPVLLSIFFLHPLAILLLRE